VAQKIVGKLGATYLRIDAIEQALVPSLGGQERVGASGYLVAYALAQSNLALGNVVVVDAVNPLTVIRETWRNIAKQASCGIVEVEVVCSDMVEHQRRVEQRQADIPGHVLPTWHEVQSRAYDRWSTDRLVLDSAILSAEDGATKVIDAVKVKGFELSEPRLR
jgi:predicted kinase